MYSVCAYWNKILIPQNNMQALMRKFMIFITRDSMLTLVIGTRLEKNPGIAYHVAGVNRPVRN